MRATKELEQRVAIEEKARKGLEKKLEEAFAEVHLLTYSHRQRTELQYLMLIFFNDFHLWYCY